LHTTFDGELVETTLKLISFSSVALKSNCLYLR
jgi:hypothetical protein